MWIRVSADSRDAPYQRRIILTRVSYCSWRWRVPQCVNSMYRWQRGPAAHTVLAGTVQIEHSKGTGVLYPSVQTFINRIACDPLLKANILELIKETSRLFELLVHQTRRTRLFPPNHSTRLPAAEWLAFSKQLRMK